MQKGEGGPIYIYIYNETLIKRKPLVLPELSALYRKEKKFMVPN